MGHNLQAFIAKDDIAAVIQSSREFPFIARLPFGLSLIPIDQQWIDDEDEKIYPNYSVLALPEYPVYGQSDLWMEFVVAKVGIEHSAIAPILFVRTEWFGGVGDSQGWWFEQASQIKQIGVNEGLLAFGVRPNCGEDAWDAVGLDEYRSSDWEIWRRKEDQGLLVQTRKSLRR
ncbi:MAG: hypothetical protein RLZZ511_1242 [Cyanobacteriota bacterium]